MSQLPGQPDPSEPGYTFAHLTDPHLTTPDGADLGDLCNKRILGYLSWRRRRRHIHRPEVLEALVADLSDSAAQHLAITGDLTQLGLPAECGAARRWLESLGPKERISLVPGNHDRYVTSVWRETVGQWEPFVASDEPDSVGLAAFPTLRVRGPVAFIGLSSACATAPFLATGKVGAMQCRRLAERLKHAAEQGLCRVVLIHHPPVPGGYKWRKRLTDARAVDEVIQEHGADLVLHGHTHRTTISRLEGPGGAGVPVIGLSSASAADLRADRTARYSLWTVAKAETGFRLSHRSRVYDFDSGAFRDCRDWNPVDQT